MIFDVSCSKVLRHEITGQQHRLVNFQVMTRPYPQWTEFNHGTATALANIPFQYPESTLLTQPVAWHLPCPILLNEYPYNVLYIPLLQELKTFL
jgi:hypothetical protein